VTGGTPEVSVVIPTRGRWPLLARTLAGALAQEEVEHEVIVVDDGSTDETRARLEEFDDPRVKVVRHRQRRQLAAARNSGVEAARGDWVAFLDDDDLWSPLKLRAQLSAAADRNAVFAYSSGLIVDPDLTVLQTSPAPDPDRILELLLRGNWIPVGASNVIARTDLVRRLGGFDEGLVHFADWDMWLRLAASGRAAAVQEPLVAYLLHGENMVLTDSRDVVREFDRLTAKHELLAGGYGVTPDRVVPDRMGVRRWLGWGHARAGRRFRAAGWYLLSALHRSPYGRRPSLRDAGFALLGRVPVGGQRPVDQALVDAADWLPPPA
jgi:glycosyltransferase involved in cell wall biosynthesis